MVAPSNRRYGSLVDQPRDWQAELLSTLREDMSELKASTRQLAVDVVELKTTSRDLEVEVAELRHDVRRLDDRVFQLLLVQVATLVTALGSLGTSIVALMAD
jgi:chromosome segregation ATPase